MRWFVALWLSLASALPCAAASRKVGKPITRVPSYMGQPPVTANPVSGITGVPRLAPMPSNTDAPAPVITANLLGAQLMKPTVVTPAASFSDAQSGSKGQGSGSKVPGKAADGVAENVAGVEKAIETGDVPAAADKAARLFTGSGDKAAAAVPLETRAQLRELGKARELLASEPLKTKDDGENIAAWNSRAKALAVLSQADPALLTEPERLMVEGGKRLLKYAAMTNTTEEELSQAVRVLATLTPERIEAMGWAAYARMDPQGGGKNDLLAQGNWTHVTLQLIKPLDDDGPALEDAFGIDVRLFTLLHLVTDPGKLGTSVPIQSALAAIYGRGKFDNVVQRLVLTHEFDSMDWIDSTGQGIGLNERQIWAMQKLIANHNFGPDLTKPENADLLDHWWPRHFRRYTIPLLEFLGLDAAQVFNRAPNLERQYNHATKNAYTALLAVYDRALANKYNGFGVETWMKFADQDHSEWQGNYKAWEKAHEEWVKAVVKPRNPGPAPTEKMFNGQGMANRMQSSVDWASQEIQNLWQYLFDWHAREGIDRYAFGPQLVQTKNGLGMLYQAIRRVRVENQGDTPGRASYRTLDGESYRFAMEPLRDAQGQVLPGQWDLKKPVRVEYYYPDKGSWHGVDIKDESGKAIAHPVKAYFRVIMQDYEKNGQRLLKP